MEMAIPVLPGDDVRVARERTPSPCIPRKDWLPAADSGNSHAACRRGGDRADAATISTLA
jgi:hypothetical protein